MKKSNELMAYLKGLRRRIFFLFLFSLFISVLFSRVPIESFKTLSSPEIDGVLDDPVWKKAKGYSDFKSFYPDYGKLPKEKTIVYSAYDTNNLYFAFKCLDKEPGKIIANVKRRDDLSGEDKVAIYIDSHNDGQNAYVFVINPLGVQQDGIVDSAGENDWLPDFVWKSEGRINAEGYTIEVKIPFRTLRFAKAEVVKMRIGFLRGINRYSEQYAFPELKPGDSLWVYLGFCQFKGIKYKRLLDVLPAFTYMKRRNRDNNDQLVTSHIKNLGITSKIGLTSQLTLDVTVNPDFSHIEIDEGQVDVNVRVDPVYDEKRPFFLEGLEHFKFAGCRIGNPVETVVNTREIVEPVWGLKLSGKVGKSSIVNSLFTVDESPKYLDKEVPEDERENSYFGIFRYKYLCKGDTYLGAIYTGKKFRNGYNHVGGVDSKIRFCQPMTLEAFFLYSLTEVSDTGNQDRGWAGGGNLKYENRYYTASLGYRELSKNFNLEVGRVIREDIRIFSANVERYLYFKSDFLKLVTLGYSGNLSRDKGFEMNEYSHNFYVGVTLPSYTQIIFGYDLATEVFLGKLFDKDKWSVSGESRVCKQLQLTFIYSSGDYPYYDELLQGKSKNLSCSVTFQPIARFSTKFSLVKSIFHQDQDEGNTHDLNISIYRNKTTLQVNKYLFLRGIVEYNTYKKEILVDSLLGFIYSPGTAIYLGYGSTLERGFEDTNVFRYDRFREARSSLFFKASYLFRL
jgi:hypothetical protein